MIMESLITVMDVAAFVLAFFALVVTIRKEIKAKKPFEDVADVMKVILFLVMSVIGASNFLEWGKLTSALDPAEPFLQILLGLVILYSFLSDHIAKR